ncbi:MAG: putative NEK/NEK2 protein kinase [Streblomastix strix]|uniref:non-specific serine/threonine protein kinase n=1 Tax=Streblomastix strix TaxID=222440 RepID=A0A5J4WS47_9EUKA|nr:MAG: putative NEK/NEK2 protein kinase [Streblomastix strix]
MMSDAFKAIKDSAPRTDYLPLVQPLDFFNNGEKSVMYYVLEYCDGKNMQDLISERKNNKNVDEKYAFEILRNLASALKLIHINGISHSNLMPKNILFTNDSKVKFIYYGYARHQSKEELTAMSDSRKEFLSPEQLKEEVSNDVLENGEKNPTDEKAADIWALGIIIFELLAFNHPFSGGKIDASFIEIKHNMQKGEPDKLPEQYSKQMNELIKRMLEKDPAKRITAQQILDVPEVARIPTQNE